MSGLGARLGSRVGGRVPRWLTGAVAVDIVLLLLLSYFMYETTTQLTGGARRFPFVTLVVTLGLIVFDLLMELVPGLRRRLGFIERDYVTAPVDAPAEDEDGEETEQPAEGRNGRPLRVFKPWIAMAWLLLLGVGMYVVGYAVMTPIFLVAFFWWVRAPLKPAIGITVVVSGFLYVVFYQLLGFT